ncbi:MAG: CHASE domain-containing protein, partial [Burkholderiaceae bacterium]
MIAAVDRWLSAPRPWQAFAISFVAYVLAARLAIQLALPPGIASPLFPAAGIALAATLTWGRPALAGVWLGSAVGNAWHAFAVGQPTLGSLLVILVIGMGAMVQAWVGARLVDRFVGRPALLTEPAQLWRFVAVAGIVASVISASVSTTALRIGGPMDSAQAAAHWIAWWIGDALGVLIFAPLTLALIGQPRSEWAPRRWPVALPLLVVTLLMGLGIRQMTRLDADRERQAFEREADSLAHAVRARVLQPLQALEAIRGLMDEAPLLDREAFRRATGPWIATGAGLRALGWNERVAAADRARFEAAELAAGLAEFRIFDRPGAVAQPGEDAQVIRFIEPATDNANALGVNAKSIPIARESIAQAASSGRAVVSTSFPLTQGGTGVVFYQAVYRGAPSTAAERTATLRGLVFATLQPEVLLRAAVSDARSSLRACLIDRDAQPTARILAGLSGCDSLPPYTPLHAVPLAIAGRQWDLRVYAATSLAPSVGSSLPFAIVGLLGAALLGALLLIVTGKARRIEAAVQERTGELELRSAELQAEMAERQRATAALRDSQQRLRNILDHVPIGVAYTDASGRIREANPRLREMLGAVGRGVGARHIADLLHPADRPAEASARERLLQGDVPMARWQLRCLTADDRTLWTQVGVSVLRDANGQAKRMVWVFEDITEHLALEEAQRARQGADAANLAKSEFLSRMSHELRTPLNAMLGFTQLLELDRRVPLAPHQLEWTGQIRQAGWHLLHMINDTLDLARIESGHVELAPRTLDLQEIVSDVTALLAHNAQKGNVRIDVRLFDDARLVVGDATRVKQILTNLLSNAIKYNVAEGSVLLSSHTAANGQVVLEVTDTGPGMTEAQLAQLFQPFNRLGKEGGVEEGTGIGLVVTKRLVDLMEGEIGVESTVDEGSVFWIEFQATVAPL